MLHEWAGLEIQELHVFIDGSHLPQRIGWAFCALALAEHGVYQFVCYSRGVAADWAATWAIELEPDNVAELVA
eukprot:9921287-Lingulodinium_polyedra.AAC.1